MPRRIVKKALPEYFDDVLTGKKRFDLRVADFEVEPGDTLVLEEWNCMDPKTRKPTGRTIEKKVTYVRQFSIDEFAQRNELEKHGFYVIQTE